MPGKPVDVVLRERVEVEYARIQWSRSCLVQPKNDSPGFVRRHKRSHGIRLE